MFVELMLDHLGQKAGTRIDDSDDARLLIAGGKARAVPNDAPTLGWAGRMPRPRPARQG